jgi:Nif-specific regulatory protein
MTKTEIARGRYRMGEGITGAVLMTGQPSIVQNIDDDPRFLLRAVERTHLPSETVAFIAVPIEVNRVTVGVLAAHRIRIRNRQLSDDVAILRLLATLCGQLLQLRELVEEKTRVLEKKNELLSRALESAAARYGIVGSSPALLRALEELERWLVPLQACSSWASLVLVKSCLPAPCTCRATGEMDLHQGELRGHPRVFV